jgi:light-regulated signal transduction histidine kinase (bacteriophytochrome)
MSHRNATQKGEIIEFLSYTSLPKIPSSLMKPATARTMEQNAAEELGRATLQIVHDLKNQLNGLKLYATFLRKRLERDDKSSEERETLAKLIAGLDNAAREMTALVRYARPMELRLRPQVDLRKIILTVAESRDSGKLDQPPLSLHVEDTAMLGEFDDSLLLEALNAITNEARSTVSSKEGSTLLLHVHRDAGEALCEWRGGKPPSRYQPFNISNGCGTIHTALAAKIIEAHGGRLKCEADIVRAWLPLTNQD